MMKTATLPFNQSITENGIPKTVSHLSISDKTGLTLVDVPIGANPMIGGRFHRVHSGCINKVLSVGPTQNFRGYMSDSMRLDKWSSLKNPRDPHKHWWLGVYRIPGTPSLLSNDGCFLGVLLPCSPAPPPMTSSVPALTR